MNLTSLPVLLHSYREVRRRRFTARASLERYQDSQLEPFLKRVAATSPFYRHCAGKPLHEWPCMDKATMMAGFNRINTAGLSLKDVLEAAMRAERERTFRSTVDGYTVGLSSGTSGSRGVFVVSPKEQARWAGAALARALPEGLRRRTRVALVLRADSNLYQAVRTPCVRFQFVDLFQPLAAIEAQLLAYRPSVLVAPASVLAQLAAHQLEGLGLPVRRVISVAEVLDPSDRTLIQQGFRAPDELYQATEGFLGSTCEHGVLHLHEEQCIIEQDWIDKEAGRFVPVVTDFRRLTQPVIRYRLDDVLVARRTPCPCGSASISLVAIEGRCDDQLRLPGVDGTLRPVFADAAARMLARALPPAADYRFTQRGDNTLRLQAAITPDEFARAEVAVREMLAEFGVDVARVQLVHDPCAPAPLAPGTKRRRIVREAAP